jgi:hypothetical protein
MIEILNPFISCFALSSIVFVLWTKLFRPPTNKKEATQPCLVIAFCVVVQALYSVFMGMYTIETDPNLAFKCTIDVCILLQAYCIMDAINEGVIVPVLSDGYMLLTKETIVHHVLTFVLLQDAKTAILLEDGAVNVQLMNNVLNFTAIEFTNPFLYAMMFVKTYNGGKHTTLSILLGMAFTFMFFWLRVVMVPFIIIDMYDDENAIRTVCMVTLYALQLAWFRVIVKGNVKALSKVLQTHSEPAPMHKSPLFTSEDYTDEEIGFTKED